MARILSGAWLAEGLGRLAGVSLAALVVGRTWWTTLALALIAFLFVLLLLDRPALVVLLLTSVLGAGLVRLAPRDRPFLLFLFFVGFSCRVAVAILVYYLARTLTDSPLVVPDAWGYDWIAQKMVGAWAGGPTVDLDVNAYLITYYTTMVAALYWLLGHSPAAILVLNSAFAAAAAVLIAIATGRLFDLRVARVVGLAACFFPSVFFWSILLLKDAFYTFLVAAIIWAFFELLATRRWLWLAPLALAWLVLADVRNYTFYLLGMLVPLGFLIGARQPFARRLVIASLLVVGAKVAMWFAGANQVFAYFFLRNDTANVIEYHRVANGMGADTSFAPAPTASPVPFPTRTSTLGGTGVPAGSGRYDTHGSVVNPVRREAPGVGIVRSPEDGSAASPAPLAAPSEAVAGSPVREWETGTEATSPPRSGARRMLEYLPTGLWYTVTAPLPWTTTKLSQRMAIPDMLLWYLCTILGLLGLVVSGKRWPQLVLPLGYVVAIALLLAMVEGNVGTLYRHRAMLIPFATIFSAVGGIWLWDRFLVQRRPEIGLVRPPEHAV
jgi:hypothetical protein